MDIYKMTVIAEVRNGMALEGGSARVHLNAICNGFLYDKPAWIPLLAWQRCTKSGRLYTAALELEAHVRAGGTM